MSKQEINLEIEKVILDVRKERERQQSLWGTQNHHPFKWLSILGEEVGEVCQAVNNAFAETDELPTDRYADYRKELIEVAAVAIQMVEGYDRLQKLEQGIKESRKVKIISRLRFEEELKDRGYVKTDLWYESKEERNTIDLDCLKYCDKILDLEGYNFSKGVFWPEWSIDREVRE